MSISRADVAITGGLLAWALLEALLGDGPGSTSTRVLLAAGFTLPIAFRRRWPVSVLVIVGVLAIARGAMEGPGEQGAMPFPSLLLAVFSAARYATSRWTAQLAPIVPLVAMPLAGFEGPIEAPNLAPVAFLSVAAWAAGVLVRRRAEQLAAARRRGPELAREAVAEERARIARELHDVVAHSVTVISVQAGAAQAQLGRSATATREHLEAVRRSAHEALVELRRLVGVLRDDDAVHGPQPGVERLADLVEDARAAGLEVELTHEGDIARTPAGPSLAAYRIVQEALTNVRRHAGRARVRIHLSRSPQALELEVVNEAGRGDGATGGGSGHGLIGMRERVRVYGGWLRAGTTPGGGYAVRAILPLDAPAAVEPREPNAVRPDPVLELARVPRRVPRVDVAAAAGIAVWGLLEALLLPGAEPRWARAALVAGLALPLVMRRRASIAALAAVCATALAAPIVLGGTREGAMPLPAILLATFSAALYARPRVLAVAALPLVVATVAADVLLSDAESPPAVDVAIISSLAAGAWVTGFLVRRRAEQAAAAQAQGSELARESVAEERARIARELHDVVAHSVTVISVQAGAADAQLRRSPDLAREHLEAVRTTAHDVLVELRRLVGVLRDDGPVYAPQPGLECVGELIGPEAELVVEGDPAGVAAGPSLAAYRILQEALTNVRRHAGRVPIRVHVAVEPDALRLEVVNAAGDVDGAAEPGPGHGLIGMRERARIYGGTLSASPTPDGGYAVEATLPLEP